mgnify:CR=1 FL=1
MSLNQIGKNGTEEFFETILYMTAYNEAREQISEFTKDIDSPVLREALEGAMNVLVFGLVFKAIQTQELLISVIFEKTSLIITALLVAPLNKIKQGLKRFKGAKFFRRLGFFGNERIEKVQSAQVVATLSQTLIHKENVLNSSSNQHMQMYNLVNTQKNTMYNREKLHMDMGGKMASRYNETLLFKLLTKSFTPQDELLMKKVLGRDTASTLNMDDLNQVADFMYTTDSNGNVIGLSETFMDLVNGLGFVHNK